MDRRTVQVEGNAYQNGANVPSIDTTKTSTLAISGMKNVKRLELQRTLRPGIPQSTEIPGLLQLEGTL